MTEEAAIETARKVWPEAEGFKPAPGGWTFRVGGGYAWITASGHMASDPEGLRSHARDQMTKNAAAPQKKTPEEVMKEERGSLAFNLFGFKEYGRRFQRVDAFAAALLEHEAARLKSLCFQHGTPDEGMISCPCDAADDLLAQADGYRRGMMGDHDSKKRI